MVTALLHMHEQMRQRDKSLQPRKAAVPVIWLEFANMAELGSIDSLPNEILRKIVFLATFEKKEHAKELKMDHKFIVDVISKVSTRFKDIAADP